MRQLRFGINVTLDGCVHHEAGLLPDHESMSVWTSELASGGALLYGRTTFEMMRSAWRRPETGEWPRPLIDLIKSLFLEGPGPTGPHQRINTLEKSLRRRQVLETRPSRQQIGSPNGNIRLRGYHEPWKSVWSLAKGSCCRLY